MYRFILIVALLAAAAVITLAQKTRPAEPFPSIEETVLRVTQGWLDADERHDRAALDKIIADDFVGTAPGGRTVYKRDIIPAEGTTEGHSLGINAQDIKVRVFGDTAIVTGRGVPKTPERAEQGELKFTVVFVRRASGWQMVAAHLSPVPKDSGQ